MKNTKFFNSKWAVRHLPALAAAVAVTLALAFTPRTVDDEYAIDPDTGKWIEVSGLTEGVDYNCNPGPGCVFDDTTANRQVITPGTFAWPE